MARRVLITGGAGYIGSHFVQKFLEIGHEVVSYSRTIQSRISAPNLSIVTGNVTDKKKLAEACDSGVDFLLHLAGNTDVNLEKDKSIDLETITGTINILELLKENRIPIVYFSTAKVYGVAEGIPLAEDNMPAPIDVYGQSRFICEQYCRLYNRLYGVPYIIVRPFTVYGMEAKTNNRPLTVISKFVSSLLQNENLIIYGDGNAKRDFIYISDVIDAVLHLLEKKQHNSVFNLANGVPVSINTVAELCINEVKSTESKIVHKQAEHSSRDVYASIDKLKAAGFVPAINLQTGIKKYVEWCRQKKS